MALEWSTEDIPLAGRGEEEEEEEQRQRADPQSRGCLTSCLQGPAGISWLFPPEPLLWLEMICWKICHHRNTGNMLFFFLEEIFSLCNGRHQGSRFATEHFWRQMQAKDCTKSHPQQSLNPSLFCTRVVCSDCKVSLQSSLRVISFLT